MHDCTLQAPAEPIPVHAGIGLRHRHVADFMEGTPAVAWLEVHSENYLAEGGPRLAQIARVRADYPLSCHGVGLSLGSAEGLDPEHLGRLKALYDRLQPGLISDHLSWSVAAGIYASDLLPLPMTEEALAVVAANVERAQDVLGRRLSVENPSTYLTFAHSTIPEAEFLEALVARTGCAILLDVNNLYVCHHNHGIDTDAYLARLPDRAVVEIHLAGHTRVTVDDQEVLIDDHGSRVIEPVWALYERALSRIGPRPTLIEWDTALPTLEVLLDEAARAEGYLARAMRAPHPVRKLAHAG